MDTENKIKIRYNEKKEEIEELLTIINTKMEKHASEEIHWGHVGDLGHVKELLKQIAKFIK